MFRIQSSNILKQRISNQVVATGRSSINPSSIRFNSSVNSQSAAINPSSPTAATGTATTSTNNNNNSNTNYSFSNAVQKLASIKKSAQVKSTDPSFPNQLLAFQELTSSNALKNDGFRNNNNNRQQGSRNRSFDWTVLPKTLELYQDVKLLPEYTAKDTTSLVIFLHNAQRLTRVVQAGLNSKPDYDSHSQTLQNKQMIENGLREVVNDLMNEKITITSIGAVHLLTSFKELGKIEDVSSFWFSCSKIDNLKDIFLNQQVVGVILPILYQTGTEFSEIEELYNRTVKLNDYFNSNLTAGMIKCCLLADKTEKSLELFGKLVDNYKPGTSITPLVDCHTRFIADCKDINVAENFFLKVINKETPYKVILQVGCLKQFLQNVYDQTNDFEKILNYWKLATKFYGRNLNHGIYSSLNGVFFEIFFNAYGNNQIEGLKKLKSLISIYNSIKPIDEPFFNIIMSKSIVWENKQVLDSLYSAFDIYRIKRSIVSRRIYLKSLGSYEVSNEEILKNWYDLILASDFENSKYIANADWAALRDSTINTRFDRGMLFIQTFKVFSPYCRDHNQFLKIKSLACQLRPELSSYFEHLDQLNVDNVFLPQLNSITPYRSRT